MSREEGFAVMDVSTSVCDDPKFRRLAREAPHHVAVAFMAYLATVGESWKAGRRVTVEDAWPVLLPYDPAVITSMQAVGLVDAKGALPSKTWSGWFAPAAERRRKSRERWQRYNANRAADATAVPRGNDVATATSVRSSRPSVPSSRNAREDGANGAQEGHTKRGGEPVSLKDALVGYGLDERIAGKKP